MKYEQRALITSIDHLNKKFEVKITSFPASLEADYNDKVSLPLLKDKFSNYFEVGDEIEFKKHNDHYFKIINLTCDVMRISRFKRDLISILRRLDNDNHPLKRCILMGNVDCICFQLKKILRKLMRLMTQQK